MTVLENIVICHETKIKVILEAQQIPDGATVTKRTGEQPYVLRYSLKIYTDFQPRESKIIDGFFLIGARGTINQITPGKRLAWVTTAGDFVDLMHESWKSMGEENK